MFAQSSYGVFAPQARLGRIVRRMASTKGGRRRTRKTAHAEPVVCGRSALLVDSRNIRMGAGDRRSDVQRCIEQRLLDSVG